MPKNTCEYSVLFAHFSGNFMSTAASHDCIDSLYHFIVLWENARNFIMVITAITISYCMSSFSSQKVRNVTYFSVFLCLPSKIAFFQLSLCDVFGKVKYTFGRSEWINYLITAEVYFSEITFRHSIATKMYSTECVCSFYKCIWR